MRRADFDFGQQLGRGSFGTVFKVKRKSDARILVCKQIKVLTMSRKAREEANQEVRLLRDVSSGSEFIVQYVGSFLDGDSLHIIMEYCEHGDLSRFLKQREGKNLEEERIWKFLIQIGLGLRWLHSNRILHRDIKSLNVFLTSGHDARLGDLGVARVLSHATSFANTFVGTPYYLSPELCEEKPYNEKSDIWAYGCVIYEMSTLKHPFDAKNHAALLIKILRGQYAAIPSCYSGELRDLIDACMRRDFMSRPSLVDLLEFPDVVSWIQTLGIASTAACDDGMQPKKRTTSGSVAAGAGSPTAGAARGGGSKSSCWAPQAGKANAIPAAPSGRVAVRQPRGGQQAVPVGAATGGSGAPVAAAHRPVAGAAAGPPGIRGIPMTRKASGKRSATPSGAPSAQGGPAPIGTRVRSRSGAGVRALAMGEESESKAQAQVITAPASTRAANVIRSARAGVASAPQQRQAGARNRNSAQQDNESNSGARRSGSRRNTVEEKRRAAREVAELPDVVAPPATQRNVPSVQQLLQVDRAAEADGSISRPSTASSTKEEAAEILAQAAALVEDDKCEATLQPAVEEDDMTILPEHRRKHNMPLPPKDPGQQREVAHVRPSSTSLDSTFVGELTSCSVFESSLGEDSLAYTAGSTLRSSGLIAMAASHGSTGCARGSLHSALSEAAEDPEAEDELGGVVVQWGVHDSRPTSAGADTQADDSDLAVVHPAVVAINSDGLLCDVQWSRTEEPDSQMDHSLAETQDESFHELIHSECVLEQGDVDEDTGDTSMQTASSRIGSPGVQSPSQVAKPFMAPVSPTSPTAPAAALCTPVKVSAPTPQQPGRQAQLQRRADSLGAQLTKLHQEVAKDMDDKARGIWEELYHLFKSKMDADLTDEDQGEIERYVFEQLPIESTEMIWKVYKVLHLEQEVERCKRSLSNFA